MDKQRMVAEINAEIERLEQVRDMLMATGDVAPAPAPARRVVRSPRTSRSPRAATKLLRRQTGRTAAKKRVGGKPMSASERQKRSAAQKARWDRIRAASGTQAPTPQPESHSSGASNPTS